MADTSLGETIGPAIVLVGAAVAAVPLFRRLGLGSVLGYFTAGVLVGPSVLGLFTDALSILRFLELGVVMFLFVVGLELRPHKLWAMRGQIFGLGLVQVAAATAALTLTGIQVFGLSGPVAFVAGAGFVLSSTAVIMSVQQDRGEISSAEGQKSVSILLSEDLMIVPLLAVAAFLSPLSQGQSGWLDILLAVGALLALLGVSKWGLNPFFAFLARSPTREVMTAGALLVVLGAALLMDAAGLSMAMGTFLAGVMLSSSSYRQQIESDLEPLRGLLSRGRHVARPLGGRRGMVVAAVHARCFDSRQERGGLRCGAAVRRLQSQGAAPHLDVPSGRGIGLRALFRSSGRRRHRCA